MIDPSAPLNVRIKAFSLDFAKRTNPGCGVVESLVEDAKKIEAYLSDGVDASALSR